MKTTHRTDLLFVANGKHIPNLNLLAELAGIKPDALRKRFDRSGGVRYTAKINEVTVLIYAYIA
jgi:hypothetical protein